LRLLSRGKHSTVTKQHTMYRVRGQGSEVRLTAGSVHLLMILSPISLVWPSRSGPSRFCEQSRKTRYRPSVVQQTVQTHLRLHSEPWSSLEARTPQYMLHRKWTAFISRFYPNRFIVLPHIHPFIHRRRCRPCKVTTNTAGGGRVRWCLAQGHLHT